MSYRSQQMIEAANIAQEKYMAEEKKRHCDHVRIRESGQGTVIDYHCQDCGKWMGDKDVS